LLLDGVVDGPRCSGGEIGPRIRPYRGGSLSSFPAPPSSTSSQTFWPTSFIKNRVLRRCGCRRARGCCLSGPSRSLGLRCLRLRLTAAFGVGAYLARDVQRRGLEQLSVFVHRSWPGWVAISMRPSGVKASAIGLSTDATIRSSKSVRSVAAAVTSKQTGVHRLHAGCLCFCYWTLPGVFTMPARP
jgi:hypothetical protein